jgi:hypothetical protein
MSRLDETSGFGNPSYGSRTRDVRAPTGQSYEL